MGIIIIIIIYQISNKCLPSPIIIMITPGTYDKYILHLYHLYLIITLFIFNDNQKRSISFLIYFLLYLNSYQAKLRATRHKNPTPRVGVAHIIRITSAHERIERTRTRTIAGIATTIKPRSAGRNKAGGIRIPFFCFI